MHGTRLSACRFGVEVQIAILVARVQLGSTCGLIPAWRPEMAWGIATSFRTLRSESKASAVK